MATAYGFDMEEAAQGVIFALNEPAVADWKYSAGDWHAELREGVSHLCVRGGVPENLSLDSVIPAAQQFAECALDILAVETRVSLLVPEPHDSIVWRRGTHGLKVQVTTSINFAAKPLPLPLVVRDHSGNVVPDPPYTPPIHHMAYRYFRYSQAASNVFDAYRNMFLALECVLDSVANQRNDEGEKEWLSRALDVAIRQHGLNLVEVGGSARKDPVKAFIKGHYSAVRCAVFHAKSSGRGALRPGTLSGRNFVLNQLLIVHKLVEHMLKTLFSVKLPSGGFYHSGFGGLLKQLEPVTHLVLSKVECPTVEALLKERHGSQDEETDGDIVKVRFAGIRAGTTDEWIYVSEIKCEELPISRIWSLRLISYVHDKASIGGMGVLLIPIMNRMSGALLRTDLGLQGIGKLVVRVRCLLRNVQEPRRGFAP